MGSPQVQLPACSRNGKSPDDSFGTTTDPTVIILVAMSQPFRDALNEAAQQYLYASDGEVARVLIFDFEYKSPGKVIRGGNVRLAVVAMQEGDGVMEPYYEFDKVCLLRSSHSTTRRPTGLFLFSPFWTPGSCPILIHLWYTQHIR